MRTRARPETSADPAVGGAAGRQSERAASRLAVSAGDDRAEREADRIADLAFSRSVRPAPDDVPVQVQRSATSPSPASRAAPTSVDRALATPGRPMSDALRRDMEPRFGHDFARVRIHADALAAASARDVHARAYTVGDDIVFGAGRFAESTHDGRRLIAHELTHVLQQQRAAAIVQRAPETDVAASDADVKTPAAEDAQPLAGSIKIDQLNVITSSKGAFSGFPIVQGIDLNKPGPFNDTTTTGSCVNVHQMQFHLAKGDPSEVKLIRKIVRVASAGGKKDEKGEKDKPADDGPSAPTVVRPKDSSDVVVSDCPGFRGTGDFSKAKSVFPVGYDADFGLFAVDAIQPAVLAELHYTVKVSKQTPDDTKPVNEITVKSKKLRP